MITLFANMPWRLTPNKIVRYPGGRELDRFRGVAPPMDDGRPEAWVGSVTAVKNALEHGDPHEGCARCMLPDGREVYLIDAIAEDPSGTLGQAHRALTGDTLGILVKLLDAQKQLMLQCHPDRAYARQWFSSPFGKTECWYIVGLREDTEEPPYVLLGFREGITRAKFERLYDAQDIPAMEACCHKIPVHIGDMFYVAAGVPHAVGPGCFLVEAQEPSDITLGVYRLPQGTGAQEQAFHKERLLGAYRYEGCSYDENLRRLRVEPTLLRHGPWGMEALLIGPAQTPYFSMTRIEACAETSLPATGFPQVGILLDGAATLSCSQGKMPLAKADEFFLPAGVSDMRLTPGSEGVALILCHPQGAIDTRVAP